MSLHWTDKRRAIVRIGKELQARGWTLFGYKEDRSDAMTDYYSPASWDGVATHQEYTGVVACIKVGQYVAERSGKDGWPTFQATPKGKAWHVEQNGQDGTAAIVTQGVGLSKCAFGDWKGDVARICDAIEQGARSAVGQIAESKEGAQGDALPRIEHNRDWTWVFFPAKPSEAARDQLKQMGGRWSGKRGGWYFRRLVPREAFAAIFGGTLAEETIPAQIRESPPSEQDAVGARSADYLPGSVLARLPGTHDTEQQDEPLAREDTDPPEPAPTDPESQAHGVKAAMAPAGTATELLPEGWTTDDIRYLLERLDAGPLLVADSRLGLPTIHDIRGAEHLGFGLFRARTAAYKLTFDAGGAMRRTPSGRGWTYLHIDGDYAYDTEVVRARLEDWLVTGAPSELVAVKTPAKQESAQAAA